MLLKPLVKTIANLIAMAGLAALLIAILYWSMKPHEESVREFRKGGLKSVLEQVWYGEDGR